MSSRFDPLRALEASYAAPVSEEAWLAGLVEAFAPLEQGAGVILARMTFDGWRLARVVVSAKGHVPEFLESLEAAWRTAPTKVLEAWFSPVPPVDTMAARIHRARAPVDGMPVDLVASRGIVDSLGVMGLDPAGNGVYVGIPSPRPVRLSPRLAHRLGLVSAHLAAACRLRALAAPDGGVEAVLAPSGKLQHAEGRARDPEARRSLALAVSRAERARGRLRTTAPDEALELWRGLVDGRWSLVDHVESDGRRVVLARRNPPGLRDPKALTARERDVLGHVVQGHGNKHVAYALGLSTTTVASHLRTALAKLGLRSRREAIALLSGP